MILKITLASSIGYLKILKKLVEYGNLSDPVCSNEASCIEGNKITPLIIGIHTCTVYLYV